MTRYVDPLVSDPLPYGYPQVGICTQGEMDAYRVILRRLVDAAAAEQWVASWSRLETNETERRACIALFRAGYVKSTPMGAGYIVTATPVGRLYLSQIEAAP